MIYGLVNFFMNNMVKILQDNKDDHLNPRSS